MTTRILIADDQPLVRRSITQLLRGSGDNWEVCGEAEDGQTAIQISADVKPDLVILDLRMPHLDGMTAAQEIHKLLPDVRIIMFTILASPDVELQARRAGVQAVVPKPKSAALLSAIRETLQH